MSILHKLQWRYAVQKFDRNQVVPESDITELLQAANLAPSALGLQPYHFVVIHDKEIQLRLHEASHNQSQVFDASHLIVFAIEKKYNHEQISRYVRALEENRSLKEGDLKQKYNFLCNFIQEKSEIDYLYWAEKQAYLALGVMIVAAADLKIDLCPLEYIDTNTYDAVLGFDKKNLRTCVVAAIGYRSPNDSFSLVKKTRKKLNEITSLFYSKNL